ncbi:hypothetical protein QCD71_10615 [Sphingomonas sp. PsM26]|nr:hypothetical protein [Sphingomonas sp. PsM26]
MTKFLDERTARYAGTLRGPRVYSTDLLPELFDAADPSGSVQTAARALKIKMLSRGLVTLNGAYLASPMGVLLLRAYPDLLNGPSILPAMLADKEGLEELVSAPMESYAALSITETDLAQHIATVEARMHQVMPWEVADVSERFRARLIDGLSSGSSLIHGELSATKVYDAERKQALLDAIRAVDLGRSANLREMIAEDVPVPLQAVLQRYATACYHGVGTGVVQCETGADLSSLSRFKAADMILTDRDATPARLSEETIFIRYFMARALATIQARVAFEASVIDDLSFENVHKISGALGDSGFQDRYEAVLEAFSAVTTIVDPGAALESFDDTAVAQAAVELAAMFDQAIVEEVPNYITREHQIEKAEMISFGSDVLLEGINATPIGNFVAIAKTMRSAAKAASGTAATLRTRNHDKALASADERRREDINEIVRGMGVSGPKKASLLDGIAAMSNVQGVVNRPA